MVPKLTRNIGEVDTTIQVTGVVKNGIAEVQCNYLSVQHAREICDIEVVDLAVRDCIVDHLDDAIERADHIRKLLRELGEGERFGEA